MEKNEKRLRRIKNDNSVLGGVTEGLGEYFDIDPAIFKVVFVVMFFTPLPSVITYLILWVVLPEDNRAFSYVDNNYQSTFKTSKFTMSNHSSKNGNLVGGVILISLGAIFAFRTFFDINLFSYIGKMWPLFLIGLGVWIIVRDKEDDNFNQNQNQDSGTTDNTGETF
ncbi:PspC domain-containing protein [Arcticibacterium luteifluviistationis]|uniref:PspC domain-containing protein n=1 Tax=Arcticibacterium luteifluviistationis TaxID=1784714 RepID=A0A2Z4GBI8_9BACT|nr:PspC domain-containing protein [Arcticibacterium luteifluviistationis]AWV98410.1 PspC domain-containing protein [Arcticibacterium luteifluviistationis]